MAQSNTRHPRAPRRLPGRARGDRGQRPDARRVDDRWDKHRHRPRRAARDDHPRPGRARDHPAPAAAIAPAIATRESGGSPASLPFTGLELWLVVAAGLAALLGGVAARRAAQR